MDTLKATFQSSAEDPKEKAGIEPISGEKGDESKGEPFDAGNVQGLSKEPFL